MRKSRFDEAQIIGVLREQEAGGTTDEVCRRHGISQQTFYRRKAKYGDLGVSEAQKLKQLDDENRWLSWGRRLRILCIVDDYTREALALVVDTSIGGQRLARELGAIIALRGRPVTIVSDNGTEMTSRAILEWANRTGVAWDYIAPGKPQQNGLSKASTAGSGTSA